MYVWYYKNKLMFENRKAEWKVKSIRKKYGEEAVFRASFLESNVPHMGGDLDKERRSGATIGIDVDHEKTWII